MKIGIIGAMDIEIDKFNNLMSHTKEIKVSRSVFTEGKYKNKNIVTTICGVGKVNASIAAMNMINKFNVDIIINTGIAGSMNKKVKLLDIVIADSVAQHDIYIPGDEYGKIHGLDIVDIETSRHKYDIDVEKLKDKYNIHTGLIVTGDQFIHEQEKIDFIKSTFDPLACEMEGAAIGHVAYVNDIDFLVIRTISDASSDMDYQEFSLKAADISINFLDEILTHIK